jgi:hypothetical protein
LISLVLLNTLAVTVWADQTVTTTVTYNKDDTAAHVTVIINGVKKDYDFKTSPSGPPQTGGTLSLLSLNTKKGGLTLGGSYGRQERVSRLPYPGAISFTLGGSALTIHIHLSAAAWLVADTALLVAMFAVIASYFATGYVNTSVLNFLVAAFLNINIFILKDRNWDKSLDIWAPVDWYNASMAALMHCVYVATPHYWWQIYAKLTDGVPHTVATR